ncbi:MAG: malto-oligosyltrehalose trehalohydrolase [Elusimicrobiota bacterium]
MNKIGADYLGDGKCEFTVWAPFLKGVALKIVSSGKRLVPMERDEKGYWQVLAENVYPGTKYLYQLDGSIDRPDPASSCQPEGVHAFSQVVDHQAFKWEDNNWLGIALPEMVIYELHIGTFTPEGAFAAVIPRLDELSSLGINAVEIMPVAQFPGERNWGYDGVYPFAAQNSYGGPEGLKELVQACHKKSIAVILDVVYNHLGPEGNYLENFGPYFTEKYHTPWGKAINFDDAYSDEVRNFFLQNALSWFEHYQIDALRLDAIHGIYDLSAKHILAELAETAAEFSRDRGKKVYLIAESDLNDPKIIRKKDSGGYGIDAQWCDDFHHALHGLLSGEKSGYYEDFGRLEQMVKAMEEGFVYSGGYSSYRKRHYGSSSRDIPGSQLVAFIQNHDQVGNRRQGERLSTLVSFEALKLAAGAMFLSPYIPLLFMGEEYAEDQPFLYFVSHSDPGLIEAVREGRKKEFQSFQWADDLPDPQSPDTFRQSKLNWTKRAAGRHKVMEDFYRQLIKLRKEIPSLANLDKNNFKVYRQEEKIVLIQRRYAGSGIVAVLNFGDKKELFCPAPDQGKGIKLLDSAEVKWLGTGSSAPETIGKNTMEISPFSFVVYGVGDR